MTVTPLTHPFATVSSSPQAVRIRSVAGRVLGALLAVLVASVDGRAAMAATDPATAAPPVRNRHGSPWIGRRPPG